MLVYITMLLIAVFADGHLWCPSSNMQMCRAICPVPRCAAGECAMREDSCCEYRCLIKERRRLSEVDFSDYESTDTLNDWDDILTWQVPSDTGICGIKSEHNNFRDDRKFVGHYFKLSGMECTDHKWTKEINEFDEYFNFKCDQGSILSGLSSTHNNWKDDRVWDAECCKVGPVSNFNVSATRDTGYVNDYDEDFDFVCDADEFISGIYGDHNNWKDDRKFGFHCSKIQLSGCYPNTDYCDEYDSSCVGNNQACSLCQTGRYLDENQCNLCTTCSSSEYESKSCEAEADRECTACPAIPNCGSSITCTTAMDSKCGYCELGYYLVEGLSDSWSDSCRVCSECSISQYVISDCRSTNTVCSDCTEIANCAGPVTCTDNTDSRCVQCEDGFFLVTGYPESCQKCDDTAEECIEYEDVCLGESSIMKCKECALGYRLVNGTCSSNLYVDTSGREYRHFTEVPKTYTEAEEICEMFDMDIIKIADDDTAEYFGNIFDGDFWVDPDINLPDIGLPGIVSEPDCYAVYAVNNSEVELTDCDLELPFVCEEPLLFADDMFIGCAGIEQIEVFSEGPFFDSNLCRDECGSFRYVALQNSNICYCGDTLPNTWISIVGEGDCDAMSLAIYLNEFQYVGCFTSTGPTSGHTYDETIAEELCDDDAVNFALRVNVQPIV